MLDISPRFRHFKAPELDPILTYKGLYALCTQDKSGLLKATHYTCVLVGGNTPIWGVWTVQGRFLRFHPGRRHIEKTYPKLVWRRRMATWALADIEAKSVQDRRNELKEHMGTLPKYED
jgi:hypothetical protein